MPVVAAKQPGPRWYRRTSAGLGALALAGFVAAGITTQADSMRKGLAQRSFLATVFTWHLATAAVGPQTDQDRAMLDLRVFTSSTNPSTLAGTPAGRSRSNTAPPDCAHPP